MSQKIKCCWHCVAPKRHVGCRSKCPEYLAERKALDEQNALEYKQRALRQNIYEQRSEAVRKASKHKR